MSLEPKRFNTGMGRVHGQDLTNIYSAVSELSPDVSIAAPEGYGMPRMAVVRSSELLEEDEGQDLLWGYELEYVSPIFPRKTTDDGTFKIYESPIDNACWAQAGFGTDGKVAVNLTEIGNSATSIMGVDTSNLPDGFKLQPVPDGAVVMAYSIPMDYLRGDTTQPGYQGSFTFFQYVNQFDGECSDSD